MTAEVKLYTLAKANATLQADLGTGNGFRWFDRQIKQGAFGAGKTCVRVRRISTQSGYNQGGQMNLEAIRFQIDVLDTIAETARQVAIDITNFMAGVDLASNNQFGSPVLGINQAPCFQMSQRSGMDAELEPEAYIESMDWRVYNRTDF